MNYTMLDVFDGMNIRFELSNKSGFSIFLFSVNVGGPKGISSVTNMDTNDTIIDAQPGIVQFSTSRCLNFFSGGDSYKEVTTPKGGDGYSGGGASGEVCCIKFNAYK